MNEEIEAAGQIADAIGRLSEQLISPNESDQNLEPANVVDGLFAISRAVRTVSNAIFPNDATPGHDEHGGCVASLTEAMMSVSSSLNSVASALHEIADAIRYKETE